MMLVNAAPRKERELSTVNVEKQVGMTPVSVGFELRSKLLRLVSAVTEHILAVYLTPTFCRLRAVTKPLVQVTPDHPVQYEGFVLMFHELKVVGLLRADCNACRAAKSSA